MKLCVYVRKSGVSDSDRRGGCLHDGGGELSEVP